VLVFLWGSELGPSARHPSFLLLYYKWKGGTISFFALFFSPSFSPGLRPGSWFDGWSRDPPPPTQNSTFSSWLVGALPFGRLWPPSPTPRSLRFDDPCFVDFPFCVLSWSLISFLSLFVVFFQRDEAPFWGPPRPEQRDFFSGLVFLFF